MLPVNSLRGMTQAARLVFAAIFLLLPACVTPPGPYELPAEPPPGNAAWALLRSRRYGQAWVAYYRRTPEA